MSSTCRLAGSNKGSVKKTVAVHVLPSSVLLFYLSTRLLLIYIVSKIKQYFLKSIFFASLLSIMWTLHYFAFFIECVSVRASMNYLRHPWVSICLSIYLSIYLPKYVLCTLHVCTVNMCLCVWCCFSLPWYNSDSDSLTQWTTSRPIIDSSPYSQVSFGFSLWSCAVAKPIIWPLVYSIYICSLSHRTTWCLLAREVQKFWFEWPFFIEKSNSRSPSRRRTTHKFKGTR